MAIGEFQYVAGLAPKHREIRVRGFTAIVITLNPRTLNPPTINPKGLGLRVRVQGYGAFPQLGGAFQGKSLQ